MSKRASKALSIVFFGTGPVSLASLQSLQNDFTIEAVITKPDSSSITGKLIPPPVKVWSNQNSIPLFQPSSKSKLSELFQHHRFTSPVGVVVDYGLIIPEDVISYFPQGIINSHFSLLPEWRGPDPISAAILSGQSKTGVSLMLIVPKLDEGLLIAQQKYSIPHDANIFSLTEGLINLSNKMLQTYLPVYLAGKIVPIPQNSDIPATYSRKLVKADGTINWAKPAVQISREIRAYLGWPGSRTQLYEKDVLIMRAHIIKPSNDHRYTPGQIILLSKNQLTIATADDLLVIDELKPSGKPTMTAAAFLAGIPSKTRHANEP